MIYDEDELLYGGTTFPKPEAFVKKTGEKVPEKLVTIPVAAIVSLIVVVCLSVISGIVIVILYF